MGIQEGNPSYDALLRHLQALWRSFLLFLDSYPTLLFIGFICLFMAWSGLCFKVRKRSNKKDRSRITSWYLNGLVVLVLFFLWLFYQVLVVR